MLSPLLLVSMPVSPPWMSELMIVIEFGLARLLKKTAWGILLQQIEFIDIEETVLKKEGWFKAVEKSVMNQKESNPGFIKVENIKGFVILTSGKYDDLWPSNYMCNKMIERMERNNFNFPYSHISFEGGHNSSTHWPEVFAFLDEVFQISIHNKR